MNDALDPDGATCAKNAWATFALRRNSVASNGTWALG
jgi:hypothetical protein